MCLSFSQCVMWNWAEWWWFYRCLAETDSKLWRRTIDTSFLCPLRCCYVFFLSTKISCINYDYLNFFFTFLSFSHFLNKLYCSFSPSFFLLYLLCVYLKCSFFAFCSINSLDIHYCIQIENFTNQFKTIFLFSFFKKITIDYRRVEVFLRLQMLIMKNEWIHHKFGLYLKSDLCVYLHFFCILSIWWTFS